MWNFLQNIQDHLKTMKNDIRELEHVQNGLNDLCIIKLDGAMYIKEIYLDDKLLLEKLGFIQDIIKDTHNKAVAMMQEKIEQKTKQDLSSTLST